MAHIFLYGIIVLLTSDIMVSIWSCSILEFLAEYPNYVTLFLLLNSLRTRTYLSTLTLLKTESLSKLSPVLISHKEII